MPIPGFKLFDTDSDKHKAKQARKEKCQHLEEMKKQRKLRSQALQDFAEFSKKIEHCKDDSQLAEVAIDSLHKVMGGLQNLSKVMMDASLFWKMMQAHCETMAKDKMRKMIETGMKCSPEERLKLWTNPTFQKPAIQFYGKWVALDDICSVYMERIQETQKDLRSYLTENPTITEARKNVRELAATFAKDLAAAQKDISEKAIQNDKLIEELQKEIEQNNGTEQ